jgi:anti-sigma regulatory factor (Ser/Thr protein kinase)
MNLAAAFPVREGSEVAVPRRGVLLLADRIGFTEEQAGRAALVVTELATNLAKHAKDGEILIRPLASGAGTADGIEILALDRGPGLTDLDRARQDGYSTAGTPGHGLGAIERQADFCQIYTHASGTAAVAWIRPAGHEARQEPRVELGAVHVAKTGEDVCGDGWSWRLREGRLSIFVADGLGHGLQAHDAAETAVGVYGRLHEEPPARVVSDVHAALRATRGAAVANLAVDLERGTARFAGLGNIAGVILLENGGRHHLVSHNGTAGHTAARIQEFSYPVPRRSHIVLFSDGLSSHWDLSAYPGLLSRCPSIVAGVLYRDFSRRRDDVTVVVAAERRPASNWR